MTHAASIGETLTVLAVVLVAAILLDRWRSRKRRRT